MHNFIFGVFSLFKRAMYDKLKTHGSFFVLFLIYKNNLVCAHCVGAVSMQSMHYEKE